MFTMNNCFLAVYSRKYIGVYIQVCYDIFICSAMDEEHMKSYISRNTVDAVTCMLIV